MLGTWQFRILLRQITFEENTRTWTHDFNDDRSGSEFFKTSWPMRDYPDKYKDYHRMQIETFDYILEAIKEDLATHSNFRDRVSPEEKLTITIRYLSTGMSFRALSQVFRMNDYTVGKIVGSVADVIWKHLSSQHMAVPSKEEFINIAAGFKKRWNFPNVVGCIDGKHVRIKCPKDSGTMYHCYKQFFSMVLQGVADSQCRFIFIDVGGYGKQSDGGTFTASTMYTFLENFQDTLPKPSSFEGSASEMPFVVLGDDAYPLKVYLMKPFSRRGLSHEERVFNYRLSRARRYVECAFGIMTAKWRLLGKAIETEVEKAERIVKCICLLHNLIIDLEGTFNPSILQEALESYRKQQAESSGSARKFNRCTKEAQNIRNAFKAYFNGPGAVTWQNKNAHT